MKDTLIVGDSLDFLTTVASFPASDGWTLKYRLVPRTSGTAIEITAAAEGEDYRAQVGPAITQGWTAGEYSWTSWVEKTGARYTVDDGTVTLVPNPATVLARDGRTHARKTLDAIEATIEGRASLDQQEYQIGGRMLKRMPIGDLLKLRSLYQSEVAKEDASAKLAAGIGVGRKIQVRL
jgi:hypothetical protein